MLLAIVSEPRAAVASPVDARRSRMQSEHAGVSPEDIVRGRMREEFMCRLATLSHDDTAMLLLLEGMFDWLCSFWTKCSLSANVLYSRGVE